LSYGLGIDLGTSSTVAAVARTGVQGVDIETVPLTARAAGVASVLYLGPYGSALVGAAAEQHVLTEPDRVFRGFLRRIGQPAPDGQPTAEALTARLVRWVLDTVTAGEGTQPDQIAITHPPGWGQRERELVTDALSESRIGEPLFVSAPVAAAAGWAAAEGLEPGGHVAVHDLGAMVEATVLAPSEEGGFTLLGPPRTLAHAGGTAFDEIVFAHVVDVLGDRLAETDPEDPVVRAGMALLLEDCMLAREALSDNTETLVPVALPGVDAWIELTRSQLESMIRPALHEGIQALRDAVAAAQLTVPELDTVLVTGGVARTPLVATLLTEELGRPVTVATDPLHHAASGAALATLNLRKTRSPSAVVPDFGAPVAPIQRTPHADVPLVDSPPVAGPVARLRPQQRALLAAAAAVFALAAAVIPITIIQSTDSSGVPPVSPTDEALSDPDDRAVPDSARRGITTDGRITADGGSTPNGTPVEPRAQQAVPTRSPAPAGTRTGGRAAARPAPVPPPAAGPGLPAPAPPPAPGPPPPPPPADSTVPTTSAPPTSSTAATPTTPTRPTTTRPTTTRPPPPTRPTTFTSATTTTGSAPTLPTEGP
jgi:molecular chaperone DnaK (HSP70)